MFSLEKNYCDNHVDNNNEISRSYVNYPTSIKLSSMQADSTDENLQFDRRKWQSEPSFKEISQNEAKMGLTLGRSKSVDSIRFEKYVLEPLMPETVVETEEVTSCHDHHQQNSNSFGARCDELTGRDDSENIRDQETSDADSVQLCMTSNRIGSISQDKFSRCLLPTKLSSKSHSSLSNIFENVEGPVDVNFYSDEVKGATLPKTKTRLSETHFRQSQTVLKLGNVVIPAKKKEASSEDKQNRLSWLRRSMKKLDPLQLPQVQDDMILLEMPFPSTSNMDSDRRLNRPEPSRDEQEINQICISNPDLFNIVLMEQQQNCELNRPRQYGRRSEPIHLSRDAIHSSNIGAARIIAHHHRASAPVQRFPNVSQSNHRSRACLPSESSLASSRNSSPVSIASSTGSSETLADPVIETEPTRPHFFSVIRNIDNDEGEGSFESNIVWPHSLSRPTCCLFCSLGLFNISRFAIFSVHFGANFLVQFLMLSFVFGIPMIWLQMVLGQKIRGSIVSMFRITPICKGIGVALMITHCIISLYTSVSVGWLLTYLRDSVISADVGYLWQERFGSYRSQNISALRMSENLADYFNGIVLQRLSSVSDTHDGKMRLQLAFNVSIVWFLVFVILCRGIRSLGQIVIGIAIFCFLGLSAVCIKFLTLLNFETIHDIFPATDWQEFFSNPNSWSVASQEVFLTFGLLGVSVYTVYTRKNQRLNHKVLRREAFLVVFLTLFGLFLGAVLGSTCIMILKLNGFNYYPASFENPKNDIFLWPAQHSVVPSFHRSIPSRWITRYSNIIGESFERPAFVSQQGVQIYKESGYKPLRLVTEFLPATLATSSRISPVWGTVAFATLFCFGLAQLSIMWKPICCVIGNSTSAILLSCITGLFLGFPLTTDNGLVIMHYLDFIFGGAWWLLILWASYIGCIFMVRGRPFTSDVLVKDLRLPDSLSVFLAFSWNLLLPLALILLSVMEYKKSHSSELFNQKHIPSLNHLTNWTTWAKQLGGFLQLALLILVPCIAMIQIYIYLSKGPPDILDRIELLFRPQMEEQDSTIGAHLPIRRTCQTNESLSQPDTVAVPNPNPQIENNDAPPKYSPPPSYSKVIGFRMAKALRNSIRRSVRTFKRNDEAGTGMLEGEPQNIPTVSSSVQHSAQSDQCSQPNRSFHDFIRSNIRRSRTNEGTQSVENLITSDIL